MIKLENVSKKFGDKEILKDISTEFHMGELTFISGTSGAGKSTLLNIIGGLDSPTMGKVLCDNVDISEDLYSYRAEKVGFVFQEANLISGLSVTQNIILATELSGISSDRNQIVAGISELGIHDPNQKVETLSGGEKQRVAVLRSLYKDAEIILADEPTGSLDSENAQIVFKTLRKLAQEKCVIVVSHDVEFAEKYADRVITLRDGIIDEEKIICERKEPLPKRESTRANKQLYQEVVLPLGKNSVRLRKGKIASVVATITMAITAIAMVIGIAGIGGQLTDRVNMDYLESDLLNVYYGHTPNAEYGLYPFTEDDQKYIENITGIQEVVWQYYRIDDGWLFSNDNIDAEACIKQIYLDDFFQNRVMINEISGRFPNNEKEIILAADIAEQLFGNDSVLGKEVVLHGSSGQVLRLSVVGVNHTKNPFDNIYSFVNANLFKKALADELSKEVFERQELNVFHDNVQMGVQTGGLYGTMQCLNGNEFLLYGSLPSTKNQVLISSTLLSNGLHLLELDKKYTSEDVKQGKISKQDIDQLSSKKFAISFNGVFEVNISGVFLSDSNEFRFTTELVEDLKKPDPVVAELYVKDASKVLTIKDQIHHEHALDAESNQETLKRTILSQSIFLKSH